MSPDVNPLAPAEDAEQEEAAQGPGQTEESATEESAEEDTGEVAQAPEALEPPRAVDQRHPQAYVGYDK